MLTLSKDCGTQRKGGGVGREQDRPENVAPYLKKGVSLERLDTA